MERNATVLIIVSLIVFGILTLGLFGPGDGITENAIFSLVGSLAGAFAVLRGGGKPDE